MPKKEYHSYISMLKKAKLLLIVCLISIIPTVLVWLPFFFKAKSFWNIPLPQNGMATLVASYDGPLYIIVAKSLYNPDIIKNLISFPLPVQYYPAHFPLFPILIKPLALFFGFPYSMLFTTILSSVFATYFFYRLARSYFDHKNSIWLTFVFSIFPARWLIVRSIGSPEPFFLGAIIASIYFFKKEKIWPAAIFGSLAQLTKSPAILLFTAYLFYLIVPNIKNVTLGGIRKYLTKEKLIKYLPLLLMPISLLSVFSFYKIRTGDFLAYFHSGDNVHLLFPPFQIFNYSSPWVGTFWLEEVIFVYLLAFIGLQKLIQKKDTLLAWFVGIFFTSILFVAHRDIVRYALPIVPFLIIAYAEIIAKKEFKIALFLIILPIYLFSLAYISQNTMPISDWAPLL
jgi:Gpi18-like mannosyltransferase